MLVLIMALGVALILQRLHNQASINRLRHEATTAKWRTYANDGVLRKNGYKVIGGKLLKLEQP